MTLARKKNSPRLGTVKLHDEFISRLSAAWSIAPRAEGELGLKVNSL